MGESGEKSIDILFYECHMKGRTSMRKTPMIVTALMFTLLFFLNFDIEGTEITGRVHWIEGRGGEESYLKQITGAISLIIAWLLSSSRVYSMRKKFVIFLSFMGLYFLLSPVVDLIRNDYAAGERYEEENSIAMNVDKQTTSKENQRKMTEPPYEDGDVIGRLVIEKLNLNIPIVDGILQQDLADAAGHVGGTAYPNKGGTIVIAGYRVIDSGPLFNQLTKLESNDRIEIINYEGTYLYEVTDSRVIDKDKWKDLLDDAHEQLALVTNACDGEDRLVAVMANKTK